jgi:antirestriction protein ArdC
VAVDREDHAAYLGHWVGLLKEDKYAIFSAAAHAQRAADFPHGLQPREQQEQESAGGKGDNGSKRSLRGRRLTS